MEGPEWGSSERGASSLRPDSRGPDRHEMVHTRMKQQMLHMHALVELNCASEAGALLPTGLQPPGSTAMARPKRPGHSLSCTCMSLQRTQKHNKNVESLGWLTCCFCVRAWPPAPTLPPPDHCGCALLSPQLEQRSTHLKRNGTDPGAGLASSHAGESPIFPPGAAPCRREFD